MMPLATQEARWSDEAPTRAEAAAAAAFGSICGGRGVAEGAAVRAWVAAQPRFRDASRSALRRSWQRADGTRRGALDAREFAAFVSALDAEVARRGGGGGAVAADDVEFTVDDAVPTRAGAAAGVGLVVAGPPGAALFGGMAAAYEALGRRVNSAAAAAGQTAMATGVAGMLVAGPPGALAGALMGASGQKVASASYVGDPRRWEHYEALAREGARERYRGFGSDDTVGGVVRSGRYALPFMAGEPPGADARHPERFPCRRRENVSPRSTPASRSFEPRDSDPYTHLEEKKKRLGRDRARAQGSRSSSRTSSPRPSGSRSATRRRRGRSAPS